MTQPLTDMTPVELIEADDLPEQLAGCDADVHHSDVYTDDVEVGDDGND